jgi:hypothetical protein
MNSVVIGIIIHIIEYLGLLLCTNPFRRAFAARRPFSVFTNSKVLGDLKDHVIRYMLSLKTPFPLVHNTVFTTKKVLPGDIKCLFALFALVPRPVFIPMSNTLVLRMRDLAQTLRQKTVVISLFTAHTVLGIWYGHDGFWKECGHGT